jgi:rhodanese-related sulfurtransferase
MINTGLKKRADFETLLLASSLLLLCLGLYGCNEGNIGAEGAHLLQYLEPAKLKKLVDNPQEAIWLIDVRSAVDYQRGHIPIARSFPSNTILSRLTELPKDKYLIIYCETGGRAQLVLQSLADKGYTRLMNWGGYTRWSWELVSEPAAEK